MLGMSCGVFAVLIAVAVAVTVAVAVCHVCSLLLLLFSISSSTLNQGLCFYRIRCVCAKVIYGSGACEDLREGIGGIAGLKQRRMARSVITRDTERRRL